MSTIHPTTYSHGGTPAPEPYSAATQATHARSEYTPRATHYDAANLGWHDTLAADFVSALQPLPPNAAVLDLACGTGLVTVRLARAAGPGGLVVGVDITTAMLDVARAKLEDLHRRQANATTTVMSPVELFEADITDLAALKNLEPVRRVLETRGGFDVISCCSALVLLPDPQACIAAWASLLKKPSNNNNTSGTGSGGSDGGRLIIDVPTETKTTQYLASEYLRRELDMPERFNRNWVVDRHSLERVIEQTSTTGPNGPRLVVERTWKSPNYLEGVCRVWNADEAMACFDSEVAPKYDKVYPGEKMEEARRVWPRLWEGALGEDGMLRDGHWLYVTIARRL